MDRKDFLSWCVTKRNLSKNSMKHTRIRYDLIFRYLQRRKLNLDNAAEYVGHLREMGLSNVSINSHIRVIKLIDIYEREFNKDLNLLKRISYFPKEKRIPVILSKNELAALLAVKIGYAKRFGMEGWQIDQNRNLALWVIAATGCRLDECLSLRKCDIIVSPDHSHIKIERKPGFTVKTHDGRKTPLPAIVIEKLKTHLEIKEPEELAFTSATGNKMSSTIMEDDWKTRLKLAGITTSPHIHDLRATYIMMHIRKKTPFPEISKLVGHKDVNTTMGYTAFNDEDLWDAAKNHPFFVMSETPLEKTEKLMEWVEKIRHELEYDSVFLSAERRETLKGLLQTTHSFLENIRMSYVAPI